MRLAAYMVGVRKMAEASRFRGWVYYIVRKRDSFRGNHVFVEVLE